MPSPTATQFNEAMQNLHVVAGDEELRGGQVVCNRLGLPMPYAGNFADVYQVRCARRSVAVKCFKTAASGLRERYREISAHLKRVRLRFMVDFDYVEQGLRINGAWHPVLKMDWVEGGIGLNEFVHQNVDRPTRLQALLGLWIRFADLLRQAQVTHADLQHGNVLLVPTEGTGKLSLKLVDYDGMFVPSLANKPSGELGHPCYQHPRRLRERTYSAHVDRFSHLVIYTAISSVIAGGRPLWEKFNHQENLLFQEADFTTPWKSAVFRELRTLRDPNARALVGHLLLATQKPLEEVPHLSDLIEQVKRLTPSEERWVADLSPSAGAEELPRLQEPFAASGGASAQVTNSIGMPLRLIPPGEFLMGSPTDEDERSENETQHPVRITRPFYLGVFEVTQGEYEQMMGRNPSNFSSVPGQDTSHLPVEQVSWKDAVEFCRRLSSLPGERSARREYRLPTEAEWEYACRAGTTTPFHFGSQLNGSEANCHGLIPYGTNIDGPYLERPTVVGGYSPNAFGLYDMHANVWEWCSDWYGDYPQGLATDPQGPSTGSLRVIRGGGWSNNPRDCRSAFRYRSTPVSRFGILGFRVAFSPGGIQGTGNSA